MTEFVYTNAIHMPSYKVYLLILKIMINLTGFPLKQNTKLALFFIIQYKNKMIIIYLFEI